MKLWLVLTVFSGLAKNLQACQCGLTQEYRIVRGQPVNKGTYPWMALIVSASNPTVPHCGATLISTKFVITVSHCSQGSSTESMVLLGMNNLSKKGDSKQQLVSIESFTPLNSTSEIAVVKLATDAVLSHSVLPICLPKAGQDFTGAKAVVLGYGDTDPDHNPSSSDVLMAGEVEVITNEACKRYIKSWNNSPSAELICAGSHGNMPDSCYGDSGGPLMFFDPNTQLWLLIGVVEGGARKCGDKDSYGTYLDVSYFVDSIQATTNYAGCQA